MALPTIVFIHGAWHWVDFFDKVRPILEAQGYRTVAPQLPSVGGIPPITSLDEDLEVVRTAVLKELDAGNNVVINAHSYGGVVATNALDGLSMKERAEQGYNTGVTKLSFVTALVLPEGISVFDAIGGKESASWIKIKDGNMLPSGALAAMYHDCDPKEAEKFVSKIAPQSEATFDGKARSAAWRKIPSAYLVCEDDRALPVVAQDAFINAVKEQGGEIEVQRLAWAHSPYVGKPEAVATFIDKAARNEALAISG